MNGAGLLAALFSGIFFFFLMAVVTGNMPKRFSKVRESKNRLTKKEKRQSWLNQSGVGVTPLQFWGISIGVGVVSFSLIFIITKVFIVAAVPAVMLAVLPKAYFAKKRAKTSDERVRAWPDALRTVVAGISSSQSLHQSLKALAVGGPEPLRVIFQKYSRLTQALDQKSALEVIKEDLGDPMSDRIIEILIAAVEAGPGVVIDVLRDLAEATTKDLQLYDHIDTTQVEMKLNAKIVFVMPYMLLVMMVSSSPEIRGFYRDPIGIFVILIGTGILIGGSLIIKKLGVIPVEQRVFTTSTRDNELLADDTRQSEAFS